MAWRSLRFAWCKVPERRELALRRALSHSRLSLMRLMNCSLVARCAGVIDRGNG